MPERKTPERKMIDENAVPRLPAHVKMRFDKNRERWVVLAPERVLMPDETALDILKRCDGKATVGAIVAALAAEYDAPADVIAEDVTLLLQDLADKGLLTT